MPAAHVCPITAPTAPARTDRVRGVWLAVTTAAALLACGCTATGPANSSTTAPVAPTAIIVPSTPANPAVAARDGAIGAYRGMWAAYERAGVEANPDDPELARYATGDALSTLEGGLKGMRSRDQVAKGSVVLAPEVISLSPADVPSEVEIRDCADTSKALLYRREGGLVNDVPGGHRQVLATVKATNGIWKVASFGVHEVGSC
jgi:hypothetical protein